MAIRRFFCVGLLWISAWGCLEPLLAQAESWEKQLKTDPENRELLFKVGRFYHEIGGMEENKDAVKKAECYLSRLLALEPENSLAMVYYGSVLTMKARGVFFPWDQLKHLNVGITAMDKAVRLSPDDAEIRLIRAINAVSMPERLGRLFVALEDFRHIESLERDHPLGMSKSFWLPCWYHFGLALLRDGKSGEAMEKFLKVIALDQKSGYAEDAAKEIKGMENADENR